MLIPVLVEVAFVGLLARIWFGRRPTVDRFATAHGLVVDEASLPPVQRALRATYAGRILGALVGAVVLGSLALVIGVGTAVAAAFIGLVGGTMVGIAIAQRRRRPEPSATRHASLHARTIASYSPAHATRSVVATSIACAAVAILAVITAPAGLGPYGPAIGLALATLLIVPIGRWLQSRIVEAPRDTIQPDVDDALRTTAVRAVHHSVLGVLLCGLAVAAIGGMLTQSTMVVRSGGAIVFRAPPGSTSISVDTGLRQTYGPRAPVRIFWIEADGSEHQTEWQRIAGSPRFSHADNVAASTAFAVVMLFATFWTLLQWARATNAWRQGSTRARVATVPSESSM